MPSRKRGSTWRSWRQEAETLTMPSSSSPRTPPRECRKRSTCDAGSETSTGPPVAWADRRVAHIDYVRADSNRVFELRIYRTVPGKLPALESRFRDIYSKLLAKHDLQVVGYWVPEGAADWDNTFVYLVAHSSREEAKKNWDAMLADP